MRIIGGALRGRQLDAKAAPTTRPTSDRVREAIASALHARGLLSGGRVLDLFAGTGALGLEALSWGATVVLAVDSSRKAVACVSANARALGVAPQVRTLELDLVASPDKAAAAIGRTRLAPFTLVFADPPYTLVQSAVDLLTAVAKHGLLAPRAAIVVEHASKSPPERPACFAELATYRYGDTGVVLWETIAEAEQSC